MRSTSISPQKKAKSAKPEAKEGADFCPNSAPTDIDVSGIVNTYAVAIAKMAAARDVRTLLDALAWLVLSLAVALFKLLCAIAILTSLSWGKCINTDDCKYGMACIMYANNDGSVLDPACEDCYFLAERGGAPLSDLYNFTTLGGENVVELCLEQLDTIAPALSRARPDVQPSFAQCLYVQKS